MNDITRRSRTQLVPATAMAAGSGAGVVAGLLADAGAAGVAVGLVVGLTAVVAAIADLRERRIPDEVVVVAAMAAVVLAVVLEIGGSSSVSRSVFAGAATAGTPLLLIHLVDPDGLGFGDVKLAAALGGLLGVVSWVLGLLLLGVAAAVGLVGVAVCRSWRRSIPFGACLGGAALLVLGASGWMAERWGMG